MGRRTSLTRYQQQKLERAFQRADREAALREQSWRCLYCLDPMTIQTATRDHKHPRARGGLDHRNNIIAACASCNRAKGHIPFDLFMRMIRSPQPGEDIRFRMIWASRRINRALMRLEERVMARVRGRR